MPAMLCHRAAV